MEEGRVMPTAVPPSGQQVEIRRGQQRAVVVEVGGGLREYHVDGQAVLDGYAEGNREVGLW
jgi:aldose 1-epimerase